jgi:LacI family transcriptional regulator
MAILDRRRITLRDVAEEAGVSKTTAVFVLNQRPNFSVPEETRRRIHDAAARLGYRRNGLAAALSRGRTGTIGLIVQTSSTPDGPALGEDFLLGALLSATHAAANAGLRLTTIPYNQRNPPTADDVTDKRVDGLILVAIQDEAFARSVYATGYPCVTIGSGYAERRIVPDNRSGAAAAVAHLADLGHRYIAYLSNEGNTVSQERREGWKRGLYEYGCTGIESSNHNDLAAYIAGTDPERPTAVVCFNDGRAAQLIHAAEKCGLSAPQDFSVIGFDNGVVAQSLQLTTVHTGMLEQTAAAIDLIKRLANGETVEAPPPISTRLIVRRSTASLSEMSVSRRLSCPSAPENAPTDAFSSLVLLPQEVKL